MPFYDGADELAALETIVIGHTTANEISGTTGVDVGSLSKYLQTFCHLRFIESLPIDDFVQ